MAKIGAIEPRALKERIDRGEAILILDVREPVEIELAPFPGARHIPMGAEPPRFKALEPLRLPGACEARLRLLGKVREIAQVASAEVVPFAGLDEALPRILPDRLQHAVPRASIRPFLRYDERFVRETGEQAKNAATAHGWLTR